MKPLLKILILEDSITDAELEQRLLKKASMQCEFKVAMDKEEFINALDNFSPDVILSDNSLPQFNASEALKIVREKYLFTPFILVTGTVSDEYAANIITSGADDYILKDRMERLPIAIEAALKKRKADKELTDYKFALDQFSIVSITDIEGTIKYVNENFCKASKYTAEELIGQNHRIINAGYHPKSYFKILWDTIGAGKIWRGEVLNKAKDGSLFWVDATIIPFLNADGNPYQYLAIRTDINEKKKAEEELIQSEHRLNEAQSIAHLGNWEFNIETNIFIWSNEAYRIYGVTPGNHNFSFKDWMSFVHPDDLEYIKQEIEIALAYFKDYSLYHRIVRNDGIIRYVYTICKFKFNNEGHPVSIYGIVHDITERKKAEQELQAYHERLLTIINTLPATIALLNEEGIIIEVNEAWKKFANENGFYGKNYGLGDNYICISENAFGEEKEDGKKVAAGIQDVLKKNIKEFVFEYSCDSPKIKRWFRMIVTPLHDKEKSGAVVMHIDISEIRKLEQKRIKDKIQEQKKITRAMMEAQENERNHLGQELHDNVNQILAGAKLFLGSARNYNEEVKELINYPMELIDNSMSEIRALCHKLVTPLKNIDLEVLVNGLVENLDKSKTITTKFTYCLSQKIISDDLKLNIYRIIQEQINNILKYAKAKNVSISIIGKAGIIEIIVTDDGKGFDVTIRRKGIGISNMMNRIESYNGKIEIESSIGNGCKTHVSIPY